MAAIREKVLVTGGAGFIGSHIAELLAEKGFGVKVLDNLSSGSLKNIAGTEKEIEFVKADITDFAKIEGEFAGVDCVIHLAALCSVAESAERTNDYNQVNINGTINVLEAAKRHGARRVVFSSSASVYGNPEKLPASESDAPNPLCPYALTKLIGENYCRMYSRLFGLDTVSLRYFNVFGPRQDAKSKYAGVIPLFILRLLENKQPIIFGDGLQSRDFTFATDIAEANIAVMKADAQKVCGETFNIARGEATSVLNLFKKIRAGLGKNIEPRFLPQRQGEIMHSLASTEKARKIIGFECRHSLDYGLEKTIEWCRQNRQ